MEQLVLLPQIIAVCFDNPIATPDQNINVSLFNCGNCESQAKTC